MAEYVSNSHKSRDTKDEPVAEKRITPVVNGSATVQKKSGFGKLAQSIIVEDARSVGSYILTDVLIPALKKSIDDIVSNGIHMMLYGKAAESRSSSSISRVSYSGYYQRKNEEPLRAGSNSSVFEFEDIVFPTRGDAEAVLTAMEDIIDQYQAVSVGDLYELSNVPSPNYTVNKYGWTNLRSAQVVRCRDGFIIQFPKATVL